MNFGRPSCLRMQATPRLFSPAFALPKRSLSLAVSAVSLSAQHHISLIHHARFSIKTDPTLPSKVRQIANQQLQHRDELHKTKKPASKNDRVSRKAFDLLSGPLQRDMFAQDVVRPSKDTVYRAFKMSEQSLRTLLREDAVQKRPQWSIAERGAFLEVLDDYRRTFRWAYILRLMQSVFGYGFLMWISWLCGSKGWIGKGWEYLRQSPSKLRQQLGRITSRNTSDTK